MDTPWAHEKSWREVREYMDSGNDLVILPVGSIEQHGPHMPMGHDALAAHHVARDAGRRAGVLVYPTLWYGWSNNHMALTGTITLRPETLTAVVTDIMASLLYHGFNRVIVVNGHRRANLAPLEIAVNQMRQKTGAALAVVDVGIIAFDRVAEIRTTPPGGVGHADEMETSHALHMNPHLVDMEKATPQNSNPEPEWMTAHHINGSGGGRAALFLPQDGGRIPRRNRGPGTIRRPDASHRRERARLPRGRGGKAHRRDRIYQGARGERPPPPRAV